MELTPSTTSPRVAVVGDVAGHLDALRAELLRLGADRDTGRLPADLTVVQVGDLVHRGPDSAGVVALVDRYLTDQPEQWVQLAGNHEAQYLREPAFRWPERLAPDAVETLRGWWASGRMRAGAAVRTGTETVLLTHAGLTVGFWRTALGSPGRAEEAAAALDALAARDEESLFRPGQLLGGGRADRGAGPLWAVAATELVPGWLDVPLPFSQVHGHTSVYDWPARSFRAPRAVSRRTVVDEQARHAVVTLTGGRIVGVDPDHQRRPAPSWRALVVPGLLVPTSGS